MKKIKILIAIAALAISTSTKAQTQLIKEYDLNFYSPGAGGYETEVDAQHIDRDGSFYVIGGSKNFAPSGAPIQDPVLVKINSDGTLAGLNKRYLMSGTQNSTHITTIASATLKEYAGYLLSGITEAQGSSFLIKTNLAGAVVWKKSFTYTGQAGSNIAMRITQVIQASNLKIYVVGMLTKGSNYASSNTELVIMKLDPITGVIDWQKVYQANSFPDLRPTGIIEGQPGKFKVFGSSTLSGAGSFIFSFQESGFGLPISTGFKLISFSHPGTTVNSGDITAMHYYQGAYVIGGNLVTNTQRNIFMFRLDNNLNNPQSLSGITNKTNNYLNTSFPLLNHITSNSAGLILSASSSNVLPYASVVMSVGSNGSVINARRGSANIETANTTVDCFNETSGGFITLHQRTDGVKKSRYSKYSSIGFTCQDNLIAANTSTSNISIITDTPIEVSRAFQATVPTITVNDFSVAVTNICETCTTAIIAGPITTSTGGTVFCTGSPFTLTAPAGFSNYQWVFNSNPVGTGSTLNITTGGLYTVYMLNAAGCAAQQTITITSYTGCVINTPPANVNYCSLPPSVIPVIGWSTNPLASCTGSYNYSWSYQGNPIAGTSFNTPFQGQGLYNVVVTTPCGSQNFNINVTDIYMHYPNHVSAQPNLTSMAPVTFGPLTTPPVGVAYSWTVTNLTTPGTPITGTSNNITVPSYVTGEVLEVTLLLTDLVNCKTYINTITWSDNPARKFNTQLSDIDENISLDKVFKISPNPASDKITVAINAFDAEKKYTVKLYYTNGSIIKSISINKNDQTIDLNNLESGVYIVELMEGKQSFISRLIINK